MVQLNQPPEFTSPGAEPGDIAHFRQSLDTAQVSDFPFPHTVIREPLPPAFVDMLIADYPGEQSMLRVSERNPNRVYSKNRFSLTLPGPRDPDLQALPAPLRRLSNLLSSPALVGPMLNMFSGVVGSGFDQFAQLNPAIKLQRIDLRVPIEAIFDTGGFFLAPHTDGMVKLITGLIYLADPGAPAELGTRLYRAKDPNFISFGGIHPPMDLLEEVKLVSYERNTMLLFARSGQSLHGVDATRVAGNRRLIQFSVAADSYTAVTPDGVQVVRKT